MNENKNRCRKKAFINRLVDGMMYLREYAECGRRFFIARESVLLLLLQSAQSLYAHFDVWKWIFMWNNFAHGISSLSGCRMVNAVELAWREFLEWATVGGSTSRMMTFNWKNDFSVASELLFTKCDLVLPYTLPPSLDAVRIFRLLHSILIYFRFFISARAQPLFLWRNRK